MRRALFVGVSIGMLALGPASAQKPASGNANWKLGGGMVEATSGPFTSEPVARQYMAGTVRFRRVQIRRL